MRVLIYTFLIVAADQVTKLYVKGIKIPFLGIDIQGMTYQSSVNVIGNFFKITFIENPGMAFGMQIGGKLFLSLFTIFATLLLIGFLYKNRNESLLLRISLSFILGGAIGNLIDRIFYGKIYDYAPLFYGKVVDFLHFDFPNFSIFGKNIYSWPIFNIADIFVTIGFLMILIGYKRIFNSDDKNQTELSEGEMQIQGDNLTGSESNFESSETTLFREEFITSVNKSDATDLAETDPAENIAEAGTNTSGLNFEIPENEKIEHYKSDHTDPEENKKTG
ncbi:MAG: signal peptidase II [Bacteroidetes bacterium]|nr:signal peptidase II [Bacteroidota bacterium]